MAETPEAPHRVQHQSPQEMWVDELLDLTSSWASLKKNEKKKILLKWKSNTAFAHLFISVHILPDKPMSRKPAEVVTQNCEFTLTALKSCIFNANYQSCRLWICFAADFIKAFHKAREEPTKKYTVPQTESQEVGWISSPLVKEEIMKRNCHPSIYRGSEDNCARVFSSRSHQTEVTEDSTSTDSVLMSLNTRNTPCARRTCPQKNQANPHSSEHIQMFIHPLKEKMFKQACLVIHH